MLNLRLEGARELTDRLEHIKREEMDTLERGLEKAALVVEREAKKTVYERQATKKDIKQAKESGYKLMPGAHKHLWGRSGRLKQSITHGVEAAVSGNSRRAFVGSAVIYAPVHEFGADIQRGAFSRLASWRTIGKKGRRGYRSVKVKRYSSGGGTIHIPARPYLGPALEAKRGQVREIIGDAMQKLLDGH